ncbi:MAG: histidine phosphatase family protein [Clostridia bacterium]|nr:histidine phosphatase family protein [Clostridia bacterium]
MIYIIRHGKTALNRANVLQGRSDCPLIEEGVCQAEEAGRRLKTVRFEHVFSSPLSRAVQTAEIVAPGRAIRTDDRLIEMDYGPYEGLDLRRLPPEMKTFFSDFEHNPAPMGMEQLGDVKIRVAAFLESIRDLQGDILISTHAIAMKAILEVLTPSAHGAYWSKYIGNCEVYVASHVDGVFGIPEGMAENGEAMQLQES